MERSNVTQHLSCDLYFPRFSHNTLSLIVNSCFSVVEVAKHATGPRVDRNRLPEHDEGYLHSRVVPRSRPCHCRTCLPFCPLGPPKSSSAATAASHRSCSSCSKAR